MSKANVADIDWASRESKARNNALTRGFLLPLLLLGKRTGFQCLTFPAAEWLWERELASFFPSKSFEFHGVERNRDVHERQVDNARALRVPNAAFIATAKPVGFRTLIERTNQKYDIVYPDYMGSWSKEKLDDLAVVFERELVVPQGYLILTLALTHDFNSSMRELVLEIGRGVHDICVIDDRAELRESGQLNFPGVMLRSLGIPRQIADLASNFNQTLQILPPHIYYTPSGTRLAPEVSLCFRRLS